MHCCHASVAHARKLLKSGQRHGQSSLDAWTHVCVLIYPCSADVVVNLDKESSQRGMVVFKRKTFGSMTQVIAPPSAYQLAYTDVAKAENQTRNRKHHKGPLGGNFTHSTREVWRRYLWPFATPAYLQDTGVFEQL